MAMLSPWDQLCLPPPSLFPEPTKTLFDEGQPWLRFSVQKSSHCDRTHFWIWLYNSQHKEENLMGYTIHYFQWKKLSPQFLELKTQKEISPGGHYKDSRSCTETPLNVLLTDTALHLKCFCIKHTSIQTDGIKSKHKSGKSSSAPVCMGREDTRCPSPLLRWPGFVRNGDRFSSQSFRQFS